MIPLCQAALLYNTSERNILNWAKQHKITTSRIGGTLMIDETGLSRFIELNAQISYYNEYLEEIVRIKKEELTNIILQIDDLIYLFKSRNKLAPLLRVLIDEMALLIPNEKKRNIFIDVSSNMNLPEVSVKYSLTYDQLCYQYDSALKIIIKKSGFLTGFRDKMAEQQTHLRRLEILNKNQNNEIERLYNLLNDTHYDEIVDMRESYQFIPYPVIKVLSMRFDTDFKLETRTLNSLRGLEIRTVEDMLRYIKGYGLKRLMSARRFGVSSMNNLKEELVKAGIIDENENSVFFKYL